MSLQPREDWKMHLYGATVDAGEGTPYDTVLLTTIQGYTGYATKAVYITFSGESFEIETFSAQDVSGSVFAGSRRRRMWPVQCFPFQFTAGTPQSLEDIAALTNLINTANKLWVRFQAGTRNQPSTTTAYPVYVESYAEDSRPNVHGVQLVVKHRYVF